jgi:ATP-dependent DNA helicase RecQ
LIGRVNAIIVELILNLFGCGVAFDENMDGLLRQVLGGYLYKDIETYGIVKITDKGLSFINKPSSF